MASAQSPGPSPEDELEIDDQEDAFGQDSEEENRSASTSIGHRATKLSGPVQKRRRVGRACDECRRKKIKCDGKQPCTHCTVYSYDCTYDQPSNRRRNPAPQFIEALEARLHKAEAILRNVLPGIDLEDPKFDAYSVDQLIESSKSQQPSNAPPEKESSIDDGQLQTMVDQTGSLDLDDQGRWNFYGHSSGYAFMRRFRSQFGTSFADFGKTINRSTRSKASFLDSPKSSTSSPQDAIPPLTYLPSREVATALCRNTIDDCCALMRPVHRPTFFARLRRLYDIDPDQYTNAETQFLPLLYVVLAVGCLFAKTEHEDTMLDMKGYREASEQGYQYFDAARQMIDITDCRDLISLQAVIFMIIFLQSSAKLSTCYAYVGIALRTCCRLGLHRVVTGKFNAIEQEERKRAFWLVRRFDAYVGAMLGLPQMLSEDDIDQELPAEVDDDYVQRDGLRPMPPNVVPLMKATNAHIRLTEILRKVVRDIYPIKGKSLAHPGHSYSISLQKIRELEHDLQQWMDALPMELRPSDNQNAEVSRVQQILRMSYAHVQMMMYRPFIHYVSQYGMKAKVDKRSFACAAACVSVARNIVHITTEMKRRGLLVGAYWFVMYTTYFAILSLVFFVLENPNSPTGEELLQDALEGRETLANLAKRSMAADRCTVSLASLFEELPAKLKERRSSLQATPTSASRKRPPPSDTDNTTSSNTPSTPNVILPRASIDARSPAKARTLPHEWLAKIAKRNSLPDPSMHPAFGLNDSLFATAVPPTNGLSYSSSPTSDSPLLGQPDASQMFTNAHIPDLQTVMFPGDNPFMYPNQPISTLETTQYVIPGQNAEGFSAGVFENEVFDTLHIPAATGNSQHGLAIDPLSMHHFGDGNITPQYAQSRHFSNPMSATANYGMTQMEEPGSMSSMPTMDQPQPEDYWSQMTSVHMKSGLTPGGVNLEEVLGGDGWSTNHRAWPSMGDMSDDQGWSRQ